MFFAVFERLKLRGENIVLIDASGDVSSVAQSILNAVMGLFEGV